MDAKREQMSVVIVGHVDHGKSTVIGRLLADTGSLPRGKLEQVRHMCEKNSRPFEYAFLLDALKDEQSQGITIDSARCFFKTEKRNYIVIDAPGHVEFLKNMVTGASRAEAALLVIDAHEGVRENSRRHGYLLSMLGIRQIAVLVNKMDLAERSRERFASITEEYESFLSQVGVKPLAFIPVSARDGDNIAARSNAMDWYGGPTVLGLLDGLEKEKDRDERPFRMFVQDIYKFTRFGDDRRIVAGMVETGALSVGDRIEFLPSGKSSRVKSIEAFNRDSPPRVEAGYSTGFTLEEQIYIRPGELACRPQEGRPRVASSLKAHIFWVGKKPMVKGKKYHIKIGPSRASVFLKEVSHIIDATSLDTEGRKDHIDRHDVAECVLETLRPIAFDVSAEGETTGRFVIVDAYDISGGGIILEPGAGESLIGAHVKRRNYSWAKSSINSVERGLRYGQSPRLIVITGKDVEDIQDLASKLEEELFRDGRNAYYLGISSIAVGIDSDIATGFEDRDEHVRRLGEIAHIFTDAGLILIATIADLDAYELDILKQLNSPCELIAISTGETDLDGRAAVLLSKNRDDAIGEIKRLLLEKEILLDYAI